MDGLNRKRPLQAKPERLARKAAGPVRPGWDEQEERTAEAIPHGKRVVGSGCSTRASRKGDVTSPWIRAEDKTSADTRAKGFRVSREHLTKIRAEAQRNGQQPAFVFGFDRDRSGLREDWVSFPLPVAHSMLSVIDAVTRGDMAEARELAQLLTGGVT